MKIIKVIIMTIIVSWLAFKNLLAWICYILLCGYDCGVWDPLISLYRGSPTSTVSTSTNSTSTNFSAIGIKFVLVELLCSKIRTSGNWLCGKVQLF